MTGRHGRTLRWIGAAAGAAALLTGGAGAPTVAEEARPPSVDRVLLVGADEDYLP